MVRARLGAFATFLTLGCIDVRTMASHLNRTKIAGIDTCLTNTVLAIVCHHITGDRAIFTSGTNDLNDITVIHRSRRFALGKTHSLSDNFSFLIDTAAKLRCGSRNQFQRNMVALFLQFAGKCQFCYFIKYIVFDLDYIFVSVHLQLLPMLSSDIRHYLHILRRVTLLVKKITILIII